MIATQVSSATEVVAPVQRVNATPKQYSCEKKFSTKCQTNELFRLCAVGDTLLNVEPYYIALPELGEIRETYIQRWLDEHKTTNRTSRSLVKQATEAFDVCAIEIVHLCCTFWENPIRMSHHTWGFKKVSKQKIKNAIAREHMWRLQQQVVNNEITLEELDQTKRIAGSTDKTCIAMFLTDLRNTWGTSKAVVGARDLLLSRCGFSKLWTGSNLVPNNGCSAYTYDILFVKKCHRYLKSIKDAFVIQPECIVKLNEKIKTKKLSSLDLDAIPKFTDSQVGSMAWHPVCSPITGNNFGVMAEDDSLHIYKNIVTMLEDGTISADHLVLTQKILRMFNDQGHLRVIYNQSRNRMSGKGGTLQSIPTELRDVILNGFMEIDMTAATPAMLFALVLEKCPNAKALFPTFYQFYQDPDKFRNKVTELYGYDRKAVKLGINKSVFKRRGTINPRSWYYADHDYNNGIMVTDKNGVSYKTPFCLHYKIPYHGLTIIPDIKETRNENLLISQEHLKRHISHDDNLYYKLIDEIRLARTEYIIQIRKTENLKTKELTDEGLVYKVNNFVNNKLVLDKWKFSKVLAHKIFSFEAKVTKSIAKYFADNFNREIIHVHDCFFLSPFVTNFDIEDLIQYIHKKHNIEMKFKFK